MPGGYAQRWTDVYQKYIAFSNSKGANHSSRTLANEIANEGQRLTTNLGSLEDYYWLVEDFFEAARNALANPPTRPLKQRLDNAQAKLEDSQTLKTYHAAADAAGGSISRIAYYVDVYTDQRREREEEELLDALTAELKSISFELTTDVRAYVEKGPATLAALRKAPPMKTSIDNV